MNQLNEDLVEVVIHSVVRVPQRGPVCLVLLGNTEELRVAELEIDMQTAANLDFAFDGKLLTAVPEIDALVKLAAMIGLDFCRVEVYGNRRDYRSVLVFKNAETELRLDCSCRLAYPLAHALSLPILIESQLFYYSAHSDGTLGGNHGSEYIGEYIPPSS